MRGEGVNTTQRSAEAVRVFVYGAPGYVPRAVGRRRGFVQPVAKARRERLKPGKLRGSGSGKMSSGIWDNLLEEKGFMQVPRALRLKRAELGLTNNKYIILLDYVDYYMYCRSVNPYKHLSEVSGVSERSIRRTLSSIEDKGLLERKVERKPNGRVSGVIFSLDPLVRRLRSLMKKSSPTVGDNSFTLVPDESFTPNTREDLNTRQENRKKKSAKDADAVEDGDSSFATLMEDSGSKIEAGPEESGGGRENGGASDALRGGDPARGKGDQIQTVPGVRRPDGPSLPGIEPEKDSGAKNWKDPWCPARWYGEVFAGMYEEAAGQPALTGGREFKSAETYFRRLRELNPEMEPERVFERATDGAMFILASQLEGGVFGWLNKPPDICMLAHQAQSVDYHLRRLEAEAEEDCGEGEHVRLSFREQIKEEVNAAEQIKRVYDELRGIERKSGRRAGNEHRAGEERRALAGDKAQEQEATSGSARVSHQGGEGEKPRSGS